MKPKGQIPTMAGLGARYPFSRSLFTNGTLQAFFGPDQPPDAIGGIGTPSIGYGITEADAVASFAPTAPPIPPSAKSYVPPADWPGPGTPLRVPQVVWLSLGWPPEGADFVGDVINPDATTASEQLTNAMTSLAALFDSVKSTIESLRPGVTFVTVVRWWESLSIPGGIGIWPQFTSAFQVIPLFCPSTAGPYLGTNFLHIYAGYYQEDLLSGDPSDLANASITRNFGVPATEFMNPDPSYSGSGAILEMDNEIHEDNVTAAVLADVAGTAYQNSLATVTANAGSFAQFGVVFLSPDLFTGPLGPPTTFPADGFSDQDQYYDQQCHYGSQLFTAAIVSHMEADFAEYGFVNGGGISAVTADGLVQRIAEYFGFDPETGLDLG